MTEGMRGSANVDPGDLGRRIAGRREELGLTQAEVATRAGVAIEYLEYLETRPGQPTAETLLRVGKALRTTARELLGGGMDRPPGHGSTVRQGRLETLDEDECLRLISAGGVGRLAFVTEAGPAVLPMNFVVHDGVIIFRTASDAPQATQTNDEVGFEVDHLDEAMSEGWSVLVVGQARQVTQPDELEWVRSHAPITPWPRGERDLYMRVDPTRITGRRIHAGQGR